MYTLHARNQAGSMAPEALLAVLGVPHQCVTVARNASGAYPDAFLRLNPRGEVPTLVLPDGTVMTESAAIMIHLADLHPGAGLAPPHGTPERASYLRWFLYLATTLYMSDLRFFYPERYTDDPSGAAAIRSRAADHMRQEYAVYAAALGEGPFFLGPRLSALDIYAAMICTWAPDVPVLFATHPHLRRMHDAVLENEAIRAVWQRNGL